MRPRRSVAGPAGIVLALLAAALASALARSAATPSLELAAQGGSTALALSVLAIALARLGGQPLRAGLRLRPGRLGTSSLLALLVGCLGLSLATESAIVLSGVHEGSQLARIEGIVAAAQGPSFGLLLLTLGLLAGIGEELFCRGWLQGALVPRLGRTGAVLVAAGVFAILHVEPVHVAAAAGLGLYLGVSAEADGSVRAPIVCHVVNNLVSLGSAAAGASLAGPEQLGAAAVAGGLAAALGLGWAWRESRRPFLRPVL